MNEIDLRSEIPDAANAIEIRVSTTPAGGVLEIFRSLDDDDPLIMPDGADTILGAPEDRRLFVVPRGALKSFRLELVRWFK